MSGGEQQVAENTISGNPIDWQKMVEQRLAALESRPSTASQIADIASDLGEFSAFMLRMMDGDIERMAMSGEDLYEEFGIHAHFAGFDDLGRPQIWIDAQKGGQVFAEGRGEIDREGIKLNGLVYALLHQADMFTGDTSTDRYLASQGMALEQRLNAVDEAVNVPSYGITFAHLLNITNLITNGDFEDGDMTGWDDAEGEISEENPAEGTYCCYIAEGNDQYCDAASVLDSITYLFRAKLRKGSAGWSFIELHWFDGSSNLLRTDKVLETWSEEWVQVIKIVKPPAGAETMQVRATNTSYLGSETGDCYLDDVSLIALSTSGKIFLQNNDLVVFSHRVLHDNQTEGVLSRVPSCFARLYDCYTAPTVARASGGTLSTAGSYTYRVCFVDADGITLPGPESNAVTIDATYKKVNLTNIPIGPYGTVSRRVYRLIDGEPTYYFGVGDNTTTTYTDGETPDISGIDATLPTVNSTLGRPVLPRQATLWWDEGRSSDTQSKSITSSQAYGYYGTTASPSIGQYMEWNVWIQAGTYTLNTLGLKASARGRLDWYIDGELTIEDQDWYASSTSYNVVQGSSVAIAQSGYHVVRAVCSGKNSSSANYYYGCTKSWFEPELD